MPAARSRSAEHRPPSRRPAPSRPGRADRPGRCRPGELPASAPDPAGSRRDRSTAAALQRAGLRTTGARTEPPAARCSTALAITRCCSRPPRARGSWPRPAAGRRDDPGRVLRPEAVLLDGHPGDEPVPLSRSASGRPRHTSATRIAEVLAELGLLHDDTTPAIRAWIDRRTGELPPGFAATSVPGCWCCSTATPAPAPGRTPPSTSTSQPCGRSSGAGQQPRPPAGDHLRRRPHRAGAAARPPRYNAIIALRSLFRFARTTRPDLRRPRPAPERRPAPGAPCCR